MAMNTLDGLPVELKICVLQQMPDIPSIRSLVLASSKYYHTYAAVRSQILFGLLLRQYNNEVEITEALVALRSEGVIAEHPKNKDKIMDLLDCRRRGTREGKKYNHDSFSIDEIVKLLKLHEAAVYFADDFPASIPEPSWWQHSVQGRWGPPNLRFSHTERARFFRAFYRMQTWCHIFGLPEWSPMSAHSSAAAASNRPSYNEWTAMAGFSHEEAWRLIWGTMPPWEVEEVGCLLEYLLLKYIQIFQEITTTVIHGHSQDGSTSDDSASSSPSSSSGYSTSLPLGTPINDIYELRGNPWSLAITFRYSMIEIGPYFLYKILRGSYRYRQNAVANNLRRVFSTKLWEVTSLNNEAKLPLLSPADRYEHDDIAKLVSSWPILEQPNKAWLERWGQGRPLHRDLWLQHFAGHFSEYPTAHRSDWKWAATGNQGYSRQLLNVDPILSKEYSIRAVTKNIEQPVAKALTAKGIEVDKSDLNGVVSIQGSLRDARTVFATTTTIYDSKTEEREVDQSELCLMLLYFEEHWYYGSVSKERVTWTIENVKLDISGRIRLLVGLT